MTVKRVSPEEALDLMHGEGYVYLDVRSVPEFVHGHPTGAYNVPLIHMGPAGSQPNAHFLEVVQKRFPKDARLVVGCKTNGRATQAALLRSCFDAAVNGDARQIGVIGESLELVFDLHGKLAGRRQNQHARTRTRRTRRA